MAAPDIIINYPNILVTQSSSSLGIEINPSGKPIIFAYVVKTYATGEDDLLGKSVCIDTNDCEQLKYGSTLYYLLSKDNIKFVENIIP